MCFVAMGVSTLFVVQIYTVVQMQTPPELVGKIMATLVSVAMCGQPIGQMIYGILFDVFSENAYSFYCFDFNYMVFKTGI